LELKGDKLWLFEVDYQLTMQALEKIMTGQEEPPSAKMKDMKKWKEEKKYGNT